jgi:hypothetical protein
MCLPLLLGLVAGEGSLTICCHLLQEVLLDKGIYVKVPWYQFLERTAHVPCMLVVSVSG